MTTKLSTKNSNKYCVECEAKFAENKSILCGHQVCDYCMKQENDLLICPHCNMSTEDSRTNEFDPLITDIEHKLKQIEFHIENGDYLIKEHFSELRRQVQLAKEEKIQELNNKAEKLLNELDSYEKDALEYYLNVLDKTPLEVKIRKLKQRLNDSKSKKIDKDLKDLKICVEIEEEKIKRSVFDDILYEFEPSSYLRFGHLVLTSTNLIDFEQLSRKDLSTAFYKVCLEEFGHVQLKQIYIKDVVFLANGRILIGAELFRKYYLFLFDEEYHLVDSRVLDVTPLLNYDNLICLTYYVVEGNEEVPYLCLLENDLRTAKQKKKLEYEQYLMGFYKDEIYLYQANELETFLVWNLKFECTAKLGQFKDVEKPFYMPNNPERLFGVEKNDKKYYVYFHRDAVSVIDASNGAKLNEIKCKPDNRLDIDLDNNIIIISTDCISYYNLVGFLLRKIELDNFDAEFDAKQIVFDNEKKFHFYDPCELYITE